ADKWPWYSTNRSVKFAFGNAVRGLTGGLPNLQVINRDAHAANAASRLGIDESHALLKAN
ncbi:MAG: hypothetical protein WAV38_29200, partial [Xanthobacteraceae bacterium]